MSGPRTLKPVVVPSVCGPGYTYVMIGYFLVLSKSNGFHMLPYSSVMPSAAFTENVSAFLKPSSFSLDRSISSSVLRMRPVTPSRSTDLNGRSMRENES